MIYACIEIMLFLNIQRWTKFNPYMYGRFFGIKRFPYILSTLKFYWKKISFEGFIWLRQKKSKSFWVVWRIFWLISKKLNAWKGLVRVKYHIGVWFVVVEGRIRIKVDSVNSTRICGWSWPWSVKKIEVQIRNSIRIRPMKSSPL